MSVAKPFENHFCPVCLGPVDPVSGDHWHYCEYEAGLGDWVNSVQPLTELEMLEKKISIAQGELKSTRKCERDLKKKITAIEAEVKAKSERVEEV